MEITAPTLRPPEVNEFRETARTEVTETMGEWDVESDKNATLDCDHLYYDTNNSASMFDDPSKNLNNRVVAKKTDGPTAAWAGNMAMGKDPDTNKPAAFYLDDDTSAGQKLYKQVSGTGKITDEIAGSDERRFPREGHYQGLGADPRDNSPYVWAIDNVRKKIARMNVRTGHVDERDIDGDAMPDIMIDKDGKPVYPTSGSQGRPAQLYRFDPDTNKSTPYLSIKGPANDAMSSLNGIAYHKGKYYLSTLKGDLFSIDPKSGDSQIVPGNGSNKVTDRSNITGEVQPDESEKIHDLASCDPVPGRTNRRTAIIPTVV